MADFEAVAPGLEVFHEQEPVPAAEKPSEVPAPDAEAPADPPATDDGPDPAAAAAAAAAVAARLMAQHGETAAPPGEAGHQAAQEGAEGNNKRPREEEGQPQAELEEPDKKRASTGVLDNGGDPVAAVTYQPPVQAAAVGGSAMEQLDVPSAQVGKLIGKAGETIRNLQMATDTRIQVDHSGEGPTKHVTITGTNPAAVAKCKSDILALIADEETTITTECPASVVGRIIGRGGETIRALQAASQAHITVDQNYPEGVPRKIIIQGGVEACRRAEVMIQELIRGDAGSAQAIIQRVCQQYGIGSTHVMSAPKAVVGRIIGRGGETIKQLQRQTGATIQIDQSMDPCRITIAGQPPAPDNAKRMIDEIINGGDPFRPMDPYAAAYGGYGAYGMPGGPYGGYGGMGGFPGMGGGMPGAGPYGAAGGFPGAAAGFGGAGADPYAAYGGAAAGGAGMGGYPGAGGFGGMGGGGGGGAASGWQELHDDQGRPYYYNAAQGITQWEKPPGF